MGREILDAKGVPSTRTHTDCTGRQIVFTNSVYEMPACGFYVRSTEVGGSPGYEFTSAVCATPYIAYLDVYEKITASLAKKHLVPTGESVQLLAGELAGNIRFDGLVVDGRLVTFAQLQELLTTHEGWTVSIKIDN